MDLFYPLKQQLRWHYYRLFRPSVFRFMKTPGTKEQPYRILIYHGVKETEGNPYNSRFISVGALEQQLQYFRNNFHVLSLKEAFEGKFSNEKLNIALSFDDGYRNNLQLALPLLQKYELPATFFITAIRNTDEEILWTDVIDIASRHHHSSLKVEDLLFAKNRKGKFVHEGKTLQEYCLERGAYFTHEVINAFPADVLSYADPVFYEQMSEEEIRQLCASPFAAIGLHSVRHDSYLHLSFEEACKDITASRAYLESVTGMPVDSIAYTFGHYTRELVNYCRSIGIEKQLAVNYLYPEDAGDPAILNRFGVNPHISWEQQKKAILSNSYFSL